MNGFVGGLLFGRSTFRKILQKHFGNASVGDIATAAREFPVTSRVDVQTALEQVFAGQPGTTLMGVHSQMGHETPTLAQLLSEGPFQTDIAPIQHDEVDVGDELPVRCLKNGLWLSRHGGMPSAVLLGPAMQGGRIGGIHVEVAVPVGEAGANFSQEFFRDLELLVGAGRTYRGRVLSLESQFNYSGRGGAVTVHRLHKVAREDVILPAKTLALLEHNVESFVANRGAIKALRFSGKKGLLFYGPPGTGKTHTIHYLASQLREHTTLLVTAEHLFFVGEYFRLARFLQPAIMVIEDVDLIARDRGEMHHPGQESLLNKLLNEMDGLREDADVLFILTTNRPDQLEPALASRPGRIDQAIEFPLPDAEGRAKLVALYARGLDVPPSVADLIVRRTKGSSPAFIKELMRRSAQFQIEQGGGAVLSETAVDGALEEMVFSGGALNLKLLGGAAPPAAGAS
jgi:ATPase family associated with various cellular activities (AAA)